MALYDEVHAQYATLARSLRGLLYVHLVASRDEGFPATLGAIREAFGGPIMLNGGFDRARADATIASGQADLVSFGRPFIANPDLVARMMHGRRDRCADPDTFYTPGPAGYVNYASL